MSAVQPPTQTMTEEEYLEFADAQDMRYEYANGEVYAITGATLRHNLIMSNTNSSLVTQLEDKNCIVVSNETRVKVESNVSYRYPDIAVICGKVQYAENRKDTIFNPIVLIEVLSPSTEIIDRNQKLDEYTQIADLQEYVLVSQDQMKIERFLRQDGADWLYTKVTGTDGILSLPSIDCTLSLSDVYRKLDLLEE